MNEFITAIRECAESAGGVYSANRGAGYGQSPWSSSCFTIKHMPTGLKRREWWLCWLMESWDEAHKDYEETCSRLWEEYYLNRHGNSGVPFWWSESEFETFADAAIASAERQAWLRDFANWLEKTYV